jgi:hypothetical protein
LTFDTGYGRMLLNNKKGGRMKLIRNIKKWWPILKEDEDWDYHYLLEVMKFKLDKMADYHVNHGQFVGSSKVVTELSEASMLISALIDDDFFDFKTLGDKWGATVVTVKDGKATLSNKHVKTATDREQYHAEFSAELSMADSRRTKTLNDFCNIFKTKLYGWWD